MRRSILLYLIPFAILATGCFPRGPGPRLAHFAPQAPALGDPAPRFTLHDLDGGEVELAELIGEKPIVLRFGSHSCPVYRYRRFSMSELEEEFTGRVHFLLVYTVEAHPVGSKSPYDDGEWVTMWNRMTRVLVKQPADGEERLELARSSHEKLKLDPPMVVDQMDNAVWEDYGSASSPAFVIDLEGKIAARQVWVEPKELRTVLLRLLGDSKTEGPSYFQ